MASIKRNIIASFVGRLWTSLIGIIFVPVYIHFIGIEAYGLIGVFTTVQAVLGLLDMGLSTTLNRELAKYASADTNNQYISNLVFTMERIYLGISILTGLVLVITSWFFAFQWVHAENLDKNTVTMAFIIMAVNFTIQFPGSLYQGGLMGLHKQVSLNVIISAVAGAKALGAIIILWLISPTVTAFLMWQLVLSAVQFFFLRRSLWKGLPSTLKKPFFDKAAIRKSGRYAAGIMGISALSIGLTQSDKIILSNLVKLKEFGYYSLAGTIAGTLAMVLFPITSAVFPKITELVNRDKKDDFLRLFHSSSQLVSLIIIPLAISLFIFSQDILLAWTRNVEIAANAGPILRFLIIGTSINSLMTIPYQYTLSIGWLRFGINISIVGIIVFLPAIFFVSYKFGALGGAFVWMILNISYFIFAMLYLFSRHLGQERSKWYILDIGRPLLVCIIAACPFFLIHEYIHVTSFVSMLLLAVCVICCFAGTLWFGTPNLKANVTTIINKIKMFKLNFL